jgi:NAD(P)-dependent dehydrogenase (short-subunit alcohol dehydrogenase family)
MNLKLTDKTALVSGSTKGIGFAIATGLAREGARVIVNGRSEKAVAEAKEQIDQTVPDARIESFAGDLSTAAATETLLQRFPLVDILVNNYSTRTPSLSGVVPGCGVWSTKLSANNSSNRPQLPLPCTSSVFRRTTAIAASPTVELLTLAAS